MYTLCGNEQALCGRLPLARWHRSARSAAEARQHSLGRLPGRRKFWDARIHWLVPADWREPYLAGNVGSGTPREMRDWIEYCNMPSGSTLAEERIRNGAAEPFRVRYWGVGNEAWVAGDGCARKLTRITTADSRFICETTAIPNHS